MNGPRPPISIVLADDHPVVLQGMASILRSQPDINVVALCEDGIAAAKAIRLFVPDIAVLDISMPGLNGLDVLSGITSDGLATKVIFLSATATDGQILTAITRGAKGIMLKDIAPESLANCVRQVAKGRQWFPADVVDAAMEREMGRRVQSKQLVQTLTPRERQVVVSLCEGNSNKMIARQLNLTEGTVKVHLSNIYNKLGVANRTALTALTIVHRDQLDPGVCDVFDMDWNAPDASMGTSDPISE
jgi:two-component system, NarL family, nitrate/nitrite response regulator NarL